MIAVDLVPTLVVGYGIVLVASFVVLVGRALRAELGDAADAERARLADLPVPAGAPDPPRGTVALVSSSAGRGRGRDGQPRRADRAAVQERAARDALRCAGARVDAAPVMCPLREHRS